ncbi:MAG: sulfotransferase domain-containing protein [Myxococcota bacterium]|nr:sulfotransferase domain-containing protein [Myxococcota bacterium]
MSTTRKRRLRLARVGQEFTIQRDRLGRWLSARRRYGSDATRTPLFLVGCQRSGTNMVMWTLEKAPEVWPYHEHLISPAFRNYRLRETAVIDRLVARAPSPVVAFKPVCDSHLTDRLLDRHEGARAVWIYRRFADVANSNVANFGEHVRDIMRWIVQGDTDYLDWRGERLSADAQELVRRCYRPDMSLFEAACLWWWLRNRFFFDLRLAEDPRVLMVRYEDLVSGDAEAFRELYRFAGCGFEERYLDDVFSSSIGKQDVPELAPEISDACAAMQQELDATYEKLRDARRGGAQSS